MIKKAVFIVVIFYGFSIGFGGTMIRTITKALPTVERLEDYTTKGVSKVYDRKGRLIYEFYEQRRITVPLEKIPAPLIKITIAMEDKNFYNHCGIDLFGVARASVYNIINLRTVQGASTITQQLARNLFLTVSKTLLRKIKEILLAFKIEKTFSKDEILELYFNQIYYGNGAYGVEAAAQRYFGKHVENLTIPEIATLVGIPKNPEKYNPYTSQEAVIHRRNFVLALMADNGIISDKDKTKFQKLPLNLASTPLYGRFHNDYFIEEVRKWVTARFGADLLYRGELSIYTTIDADLQKIAEKAIKNSIPALEEKFRINKGDTVNPLQAALLAMDVKSGAILAEVGGKDFSKSMFNRAVQALRQPGSAFKPFVWITALADTFTAADIVEDEPISVKLVTGQIYSPGNHDHKFFGPITLREGIAHSRNLVSVRLIMSVGPEQVAGYARRMGITTYLDPVIALSLGSSSVTLLDMVSAYSTIGNYGVRTIPYMIERVVDKDGTLLYNHQEFEQQVISPQLAYIAIDLMQSVLNEGTGIGARSRGFYYPAAGKTGTTDECTDAWFIGFTPSLACGVWVGFDHRKRIGRNATGSEVALPIWTEFMTSATQTLNSPYEDFQVPEGLVWKTVCKKCGKLATGWSKDTRKEVFIKGTEPTEYCTGIHPKSLRFL